MDFQIQLELSELQKFLSEASYDRTRDVLKKEIIKVEAEIAVTRAKVATIKTAPKVRVQLFEHAFDQSEKFIKIYIPFNISAIKDESVTVEFTENSFNVLIQTEDKTYEFIVKNLLKSIDVSKSYKKVSVDMVTVYMKKATEGAWECYSIRTLPT